MFKPLAALVVLTGTMLAPAWASHPPVDDPIPSVCTFDHVISAATAADLNCTDLELNRVVSNIMSDPDQRREYGKQIVKKYNAFYQIHGRHDAVMKRYVVSTAPGIKRRHLRGAKRHR